MCPHTCLWTAFAIGCIFCSPSYTFSLHKYIVSNLTLVTPFLFNDLIPCINANKAVLKLTLDALKPYIL